MKVDAYLKCDRHVVGDPACQGEPKARGYYAYDDHNSAGDPYINTDTESCDLCDAAHQAVLDGVRQLTKKLTKKVRVARPRQQKPAAEATA